MIKEIVLDSWPNMEDYLFMILILGRDIPLIMKTLAL